MRGSESKHVIEGLTEERKALALRYTVDAEEARRLDLAAAAQGAAAQGEGAGRTRALAGRTGSGPVQTGATAPAPRPSQHMPSVKDRLGRVLHRPEGRVAPEIPTALCCARCGRECSREHKDWTLRLCADDQLHPVCHGCDERDFSDAGGLRGSLPLRPLAD